MRDPKLPPSVGHVVHTQLLMDITRVTWKRNGEQSCAQGTQAYMWVTNAKLVPKSRFRASQI